MKIGILGMGSAGSRHAENLKELGCEILPYDPKGSLCSRDEALDKSDAIVVASPIKEHYADLMDAIATGVPVFCEKPIAHIGHDKFKGVAMVGYNLRFHPCVIMARQWDVGRYLWADFVCAQKNEKYTEHVALNWSHELDLALHLTGPAWEETIHAVGDEHMVKTIWRDEGGACCVGVHLDYLTTPEVRQFIIAGEEGTIIADLVRRRAWVRAPSGEIIDELDASYTNIDEDYLDEMKEFVGIVNGDRPYNKGATGAEALEVLEVSRKIMEQAP